MFKLLKCLKNKWYLFLITLIAIVAQCYLQLMLPEYMGNITTLISQGGDNTQAILVQGGWMILVSVGVVVLATIQNYLGALLSAICGRELRDEVFHKVTNLDCDQYNKYGTATLITRTTNDIEQIKNYLLMAIRTIVMSPTYILIGLIKTLTQNAMLSIVLAVCIPLIIALMFVVMHFATPLFRQIQTKIDNLTVVLRGNLTGIRVIRAYNQQETEYHKFDNANKDMTHINKVVNKLMTVVNPSVNIIFNLCFIGIYGLGFYLIEGLGVVDGALSPEVTKMIADISVVAQYSMQIMQSFLMLAMVAVFFPQASACSRRINEILDLKNDFDEEEIDPEKTKLYENRNANGVLKFDNVSFAYPDSEQPCITDISFETKPGKTTAIIGSTGSGKSTVINLIPRLYDVTCGNISLDGINIKNLNVKDLRNSIGFVPQKAVLFKGNIRDNLKFGNDNATDEEIYRALDVAQARNFVDKLPDKLDSYVAQGGKNFSGGQKQRLAIARTLVKKPEVYVFDDSFSALDFKTDAKLRAALKDYVGNSSVVIVAQRVSSILDADQIIVLNDGKMVGKGTHAELLKSCQVYQDIVRSQLDRDEVEKTIALMQQASMKGGN